MSVREINDESHFQAELAAAKGRLVVADFTATWCMPCQRIAPLFALLPEKYPTVIFLKIDVDKCNELAGSQEVSAMPTFIFYKNRTKIDNVRGADILAVEKKIQKYVAAAGEDNGEQSEEYGQGLIELNSFISKQDCECLNEADDHTMAMCLSSEGGFLQSDCDEQLILSVTFNQVVKIHSLKIKAPPKLGPKEIKLFINQPRTIDFDMAESMNSVQDLTLDEKELEKGPVMINLRYVKFQNVQNIQIYVRNNQSGGELTQIDYIGFIGSPLMTTKMTEFKRVAGKKGESH